MGYAYPQPYLDFLAHFHGNRDFFECHEILEKYWKEHPDSPYPAVWAGLIQAAVGMYHYRRDNRRGAMKSLAGALDKADPAALPALGIDAPAWRAVLSETLKRLEAADYYRDIDIPLSDSKLEAMCRERCRELGFEWLGKSRLDRPELVHRHTLRDRTGVIEERRQAMARRNGMRRSENENR